jgi:vancomycin resistance protein YoaR
VVVGNQEKLDYGGGICGASSAIYQWIVSNWSLQTPRVRNHTRWYGYLYDAYIDGELVTTPWIDSAVFDGSLDLEMVNTASHPIVLVMNYDGTLGWVEEVFTVGRSDDRQNIEFVSSYPITYTWPSWVGTGEITTRWGCYTWLIGEETVKRCYRKVSE